MLFQCLKNVFSHGHNWMQLDGRDQGINNVKVTLTLVLTPVGWQLMPGDHTPVLSCPVPQKQPICCWRGFKPDKLPPLHTTFGDSPGLGSLHHPLRLRPGADDKTGESRKKCFVANTHMCEEQQELTHQGKASLSHFLQLFQSTTHPLTDDFKQASQTGVSFASVFSLLSLSSLQACAFAFSLLPPMPCTEVFPFVSVHEGE